MPIPGLFHDGPPLARLRRFRAAVTGNTAPLGSLWVFIVGPILGASLAASCYKYLEK